MTNWTVCAPTGVEAVALKSRIRGGRVARTGVGHHAEVWAAHSDLVARSEALAVAGIAGALERDLVAGDVVVATEVRAAHKRSIPCPSAPLLASALRRAGLQVFEGPVITADHVVTGAQRRLHAQDGALCVDMESASLLASVTIPVAVVRVIADTATEPMLRPATAARMITALRTLAHLGPVLEAWGQTVGPRTILLAGPRSFCAGVVRAVDIVEHALAQRGAPVYVRKQIVHNTHVVEDLASRGAVFVDELDEVPTGATVVFSAHGVAPAVREEAQRRDLRVIDATCPLVSKVHAEVRRFADAGDTVVYLGHAGHEETDGTIGERPAHTLLVQDANDARTVAVADPDRVSYVVQTTLAADEVAELVDILQARFPNLQAPPSDDICYATTNRQTALEHVAGEADLTLVVGSTNSSNSQRLVERSLRMGKPAHLIEDASDIRLEWLRGVHTIALTAGASAPMSLVDEVMTTLGGLGPVDVIERLSAEENVSFTLPKEVR